MDLWQEAYENGLSALPAYDSYVVPPWLSVAGYKSSRVGLVAMVDIQELTKGMHADDDNCFLLDFGLLDLPVTIADSDNDAIRQMFTMQFYRYVEGNLLNITIMHATPYQRSKGTWYYMVNFTIKSKDGRFRKTMTGEMVVSKIEQPTTIPPVISSPRTLTCELIGDLYTIAELSHSSTFHLTKKQHPLERIVGVKRDKTSYSSFFTSKLVGVPKTYSAHRSLVGSDKQHIEEERTRIAKERNKTDEFVDLDLL